VRQSAELRPDKLKPHLRSERSQHGKSQTTVEHYLKHACKRPKSTRTNKTSAKQSMHSKHSSRHETDKILITSASVPVLPEPAKHPLKTMTMKTESSNQAKIEELKGAMLKQMKEYELEIVNLQTDCDRNAQRGEKIYAQLQEALHAKSQL
jgi:hypothetical protein